MIKRVKKLGNAGDTIVEVLIVLAVLGLALSIGYATATRGLQQSRNAQEHSQALGIINSQVELLRSAFAKQNGAAVEAQAASGPFCLSSSSAAVSIQPLSNSGDNQFREDIAADKLDPVDSPTTYPGPCTQDSRYRISIVGRGGGVYDFRVRWEGISDLGRQQEELTYKIGNVTISPTGGYPDPELPPPPVGPPSLTVFFNASPVPAAPGNTLALSWSTSPSGASCTASDGWSGNKAANGNQNISIPAGGASYTLKYTLSCTLNGATDSKTINVPVAPKTYLFKGAEYGKCISTTGDCYTTADLAVFSCWPFTADYDTSTKSVENGNYQFTLEYSNGGAGRCSSTTPPPASLYQYKVKVYLNNNNKKNEVASLSLNPPSGTANFNINNIKAGDVIKIQWTNDYIGTYDANFQINKLTLKKL